MRIRADDEGWQFEEMDPVVEGLLRMIPECASPDDEAAGRRIFSAPTGGKDPEADREWTETVEPELRELFKSHVDVVAADLSAMKEDGEAVSMSIPMANVRAWIHTLNQARLALAARHGFTEEDISGAKEHTGEESFAIMQIDFYGTLLGLLLRRVEL